MPEKRKKEEKQPQGVDLMKFFSSQEEQPQAAAGSRPASREEALLTEEVEKLLLQRIKQEPSGLTRSQLYEWSKKRGVNPASFYRALTSLIEKGLVQRKFDSTREEYVFIAVH
ncbi:hypothetical protein [Infirmifilum sp. NZ]|uniref:hypothetical protein n=1 Tax=Infirmifilum sp. NZ TaxID=2926850 RepID=UPI0027A70851|nr:hypothetical protein [Infirmifilum sp. NZ]UNQ74346.1 hypothetical protein MOV14_04895 [Infirmifilum sp. NZ]